MAKFKKKEAVKIEYPGRGAMWDMPFTRYGKVVGVVPKGRRPDPARFKFKRKPSGGAREHLSYIVQDQHTGYCYWPLVKYIQAA